MFNQMLEMLKAVINN